MKIKVYVFLNLLKEYYQKLYDYTKFYIVILGILSYNNIEK